MQPDLLAWTPPDPADFKGATFDSVRDGDRLNAQCKRVFDVMIRGEWETLAGLSAKTGDPQASVSARIRDLRRFGFHIDKEYVQRGLWRYRMVKG